MPDLSTSRIRLLCLATLAAGGVLLAQTGTAVADPDPGTTAAATSASSGSTVTGGSTVRGAAATGTSTTGTSTGSSTTGTSTTGASATGASSTGATGSTPAGGKATPIAGATAGPPCTTNATAAYPVICLPADSGEDEPGVLTAGEPTEFDAQIVDNGPAVTHARVVITLPAGLRLESDEPDPVTRVDDWSADDGADARYTDLDCTPVTATVRAAAVPAAATTSVSCDVGALPQGANILVSIDLEVVPGTAVGSTQTFSVTLAPAAGDDYPSTQVQASLLVLAPAHLVVSLNPSAVRADVGSTTTLTGTVRNAGPGVAPQTVAVAISGNEKDPGNSHFSIVDGSDLTVIGGAGSTALSGLGSTARAALARQAAAHRTAGRPAVARPGVRGDTAPSARFWPVGTLAAGASAHVQVTVKALSAGTDTLFFGAQSDVGDPVCDDGSGDPSGPSDSVAPVVRRAAATTAPAGGCQDEVSTTLTAVDAAAVLPLANSGTHDLDVQVGVAVWALVAGALLAWAGRRRVARVAPRHRH